MDYTFLMLLIPAVNCWAILRLMKRQQKETPRVTVCINNTDYPASLELHKIYRVVPDDDAV